VETRFPRQPAAAGKWLGWPGPDRNMVRLRVGVWEWAGRLMPPLLADKPGRWIDYPAPKAAARFKAVVIWTQVGRSNRQ